MWNASHWLSISDARSPRLNSSRLARPHSGSWPIVLVVTVLALSACTPLPIPVYLPGDNTSARSNLDERTIASIRPGSSTRASVLDALGEPEDKAPDASWYAYAARISRGEWKVLYGPMDIDQAVYATGERVSYHTLLVHFDAEGRVRDVMQDVGTCVAPCAELRPGRSWEQRLAYAKAKELIEPGEVIREGFVSAVWRSNHQWIPGAAVVTDRALLYLARSMAGPVGYRPGLRVPATDIASVSYAASSTTSDFLIVRIGRTDGSGEELAFKPLPGQAPYEGPPFDRERAQRFIESVLLLDGQRQRK